MGNVGDYVNNARKNNIWSETEFIPILEMDEDDI